MAHFIKTGFWEKAQIGFKGWLNLDDLIQQIAGGGGSSIQFQDNGSDLGDNQATTVDFDGPGVSGNRVGNVITYTISGGGGGSVPSFTTGDALKQIRVNALETAYELFTPVPNPMTDPGDLIQGGASGAPTRLAGVATGNALISGGLGTAVSWGKIGLSTHVSGDLPLSNLAQGSALSVLGVTGNAVADFASIVAGSDGQVLRRSGTSVAFGALDLASANAVTGVLPVANFSTGTPTGSKFVRDDGVLAVPGVSSVIFNGLTAATGTNTIDNTLHANEWQWSTLAGSTGLRLSSASTAAASNLQRVFEVLQTGANGTSTQSTWAGRFSNTKTGTSSTNIGAAFEASGGTTNLAIKTEAGNVLIGNAAADSITSNTRVDIRGTGTTASTTALRVASSASVARFVVTDAGTITQTPTAVNSNSIVATYTTDADNRFIKSTSGTVTLRTTSGETFFQNTNTNNLTTGATNQVLVADNHTATYTANHTGVTLRGYYWNPTIAGSQAFATHNAFHATSGNVVIGNGNLTLGTAGNRIEIKTGSNASAGVATLVGGTVTVNTTAVTANSIILLTSQSDGGTPGFVRVTAKTAATSFVITSSDGADTSVIGWFIIEGN